MNIQRIVRKTAFSCSAALMMMSIGVGTVSAHHIHHFKIHTVQIIYLHYGTRHHKHRVYRHHRRKIHGTWINKKRYIRYERYLKHRRVAARLDNQGSSLTNGIRQELLHDINRDRHTDHRSHLSTRSWLQAASNYRVKHALHMYEAYTVDQYDAMPKKQVDNLVHGFAHHNALPDYFHRHHIRVNSWAENACDYTVGNPEYQSDRTLAPYDNSTAKGIADNIDDDFMHHDMAEHNNNGHRYNELDPYVRHVNVSVKYDSQRNYGSIIEDYAS